MSRINFLFVLIIGLTACTPNTTPSPVVTSSPTASIPPTSTATEIPSIPNPIDPENMDVLTMAGYVWNAAYGTLERNGKTVLELSDGSTWVDEAGVESSVESLKINLTNGVDFEGKPIVALLTREVDGQREMYNFIVDDWQEPMDIEGSIEAISKNNIPKSLENWKVQVKIEFEGVHEASWEDFKSGRLFLSDLLNLEPLPENVNIQPLLISQEPLIQNVWTLGQFRAAHLDYYGEPGSGERPPNKSRPVLAENDAIRIVSAHKMRSPLTGEWLTVTGVRYQVNGQDLLLYSFTGGSTTVPTEEGGAYNLLEDVWSYPARRILLPILSAKAGDACGLGPLYASQPVCDLVGYDGTPVPRELLPEDLKIMISAWDSDTLLTGFTLDTFAVDGNWVFSLQNSVLPANFVEHSGRYFLSEEDPRLDTTWPD